MKYIEIKIHTTENGIEPIVGQLYELDITDTVVDDPRDVENIINKENDYDWDYMDQSVVDQLHQEPMVRIYLEDTEENRDKIKVIKEAMKALEENVSRGNYGAGMDFGSLEVEASFQTDDQWKDNWKEFFKPTKISKSIVVKPTWEEYEKKDDEIVLEIDPGMAFGTGTHETTSLCVRLMEKYMNPKDRVLDVGCGSGILSITAALLGASKALGVEIDPVAVEVAKENIILNNVGDVAAAQYGDLTKGIEFKANLVVANLMADLVKLLSADVAKHLEDGGIYISSGILVEKKEEVVETIKNCGFTILEIAEDGEWCAVVGRK